MENSQYLSELSKCVRCGSCKALCPTYEEESTESTVARGRLALLSGLSSGQLAPSPVLTDRIFSCMLCGQCSGLCPPGIDIKEVICHGRSILKKADKRRRYLRFLARFSARNPKLSFRLLSISQHILFPYLFKKGLLPFKPDLTEHQTGDRLQVYTVSRKKGRVAVFTGCIINFFYPHLVESLVNVLHKLGYEVILPVGEVCCGTPLRTLGLAEEAAELAKKNLGIFNSLNVDAILSLCPACTLAIKVEYKKILGEAIDKAIDISSFFIDELDPSLFSLLPPRSAAYHNPCHLKYELGIEKEPREIMKKIGINLMETQEQKCCGFAGIFSLSYKKLSEGLLNKCVSDYIKTEAETIITSCPGCMIQLAKGINDKPVLHLIEVIEESLFQHS